MSVVPLLLGDSDSLSVSYGMEPEQETLRESESPKSKGTTLKLGVRLKHVRFVPLTVLLTL